MSLPDGYNEVTEKAIHLAQEAIRYNWSLENAIHNFKEAWVYAHEISLQQAKCQVEQVKL